MVVHVVPYRYLDVLIVSCTDMICMATYSVHVHHVMWLTCYTKQGYAYNVPTVYKTLQYAHITDLSEMGQSIQR